MGNVTTQSASRTSSTSSSVGSMVGMVMPSVAAASAVVSTIQQYQQHQYTLNHAHNELTLPPGKISRGTEHSGSSGLAESPMNTAPPLQVSTLWNEKNSPVFKILNDIGTGVYKLGSAVINILKLVASIFMPRK